MFYSKSASAGAAGASDALVNSSVEVSLKSAEDGVSGARSIWVVVTSGVKSLKSAAVGVTGARDERLNTDSGTTSEKSASDGVVGASVARIIFEVS